jgi:type II secretory pathway pseudopilin PulG
MSATDQNRQRLENRRFFRRPPGKGGGFTFFGLLIIVAIMGAGLAAAGGLYSHAAQRDKERELLFVGNQFRAAIESYYRRSPGAAAFPKSLDELVEDKRFPMPQRHLRRIYADPLTGKPDWALVKTPDGAGIMGVHSRAQAAPAKTANFDARDAAFEDKEHYSDWQFVYVPSTPNPGAPPASPKGPAP